jgi:soluble lytic murein transglycosylase-like protein
VVNVYLSGQDARNAAADLWQQDQIKRVNDQFAPPPPPPPEPAPAPPPAPVEAAGGQGSSLNSPVAGPALTQPAPSAAVTAPNPTPDRSQIADQWQRGAVADAWEQNALSDVMKGVSQAGAGVQSALSQVPQQAQGLVSNLTALPGAQPQSSAQPAPAGIPAPQPTQGQVATVAGGGDLQSYARQAAQRYGVDPDIFQRQIQQESGFNPTAQSPAGAQGVAQFMPETARGMGVDPSDPYASLDGAARLMRQNLDRYGGDYPKALAAYNAGPGNVDKYGGVPPFAETQTYVKNILGGIGQAAASVGSAIGSAISGGGLQRPSQFGLGLSAADAYAFCGPTAAIACAQKYGRMPTIDEARQLAVESGWTQGGGMNGVVNEKKLLDAMGVPTKLETTVDWSKISTDVSNGNPVIVSTPGHYFTIDQAKPAQGGDQMLYHVGTSGTDLKAGAEWMTQAQIEHLEGQANGVLYADNPTTPTPSIAATVGGAIRSVAAPIQQKAQDIISAVGNIGAALNNPTLPQDIYNRSPIGAFNAMTQQIGPALGQSGLGQWKAQNFPSILDPGHPVNVAVDLEHKYGTWMPDDKMTPEDRDRANSLMFAFGGMEAPAGPEGIGEIAPKAANINLAKYPTEVQDVIQAAAPTIPTSATRGVVPDAVVRDLAQMSGTSVPDIVANWQPGQAQNAETLYALRDALANQGRQVLDAQQALRMNPTSADAQAQLVEALTQHRAIQEVVQGTTAEAGRALRQFTQPIEGNIAALQQLQNLAQRTGQSVDSLARDLAGIDLNDPAQMAEVARVLNPPRLPPNEYLPVGPQPGQYGMFGQELPLGGPRPQGSELLGPAGPQPGQFQFESQLPLGGPRPAGTEPPLPAGRMPGQTGLGIGEQYQQDLMAPGRGPFETPATLPDLGPSVARTRMAIEQRQGLGANPNAPAGPTGGRAGPQGLLPGFPNPNVGSFWQVLNAYHSGNVIMGPATAVKVAANTMFAPLWNLGTQSVRDLGTLNFDRVAGRGIGTGQAIVNIGNDFMDGFRTAMANRTTSSIPLVDQFLQAQRAVGGAMHAGMQNVAAETVRRMELGAAAGEFVASQRKMGAEGLMSIADLVRDPSGLPSAAVARANDLGARAGLRAPAGATQQTVQNMLNEAANTPVGAVTNFLLPVFRIGAQAAARGIEASPLGLAGTAFDVARAGLGKGPYAGGFSQYGQAVTPLADRLTNNLAGTAITAWLASKALDGTVTGTGPDDPRQRANLEAQGWRPQSVLVPGTGYVSYSRLPEQLRVPLELAAAFGEASNGHKGDPMGTAAALMQGVGKMLIQGLPGLSTLGDVGGILKGDPYAVGYLLGGGLSGYVPGSGALSNIAQATDPYARQIPTRQGFGPAVAGNIQQSLPGARQQLEPRINVLGQNVPNPAAGVQGLLPWRTPGEVEPGTPGLRALGVLNQAGMTISAAPPNITYQGRQIALSPDEQQFRQQIVAQRLDQTLKGYMDSQKFQALPQDQQKRALEPLVRAAGQYADQRVIAAMTPEDRRSRIAMAPRTGAPAPVYSGSGGLASLVARQSAAEADAAHQRLLAQYAGQANPALAGPAVAGAAR